MALGEVDYGLMGLVGGLTVFVSFFNSVLAGATARYYGVSIGACEVAENKERALEECRIWFNTALSLHLILPIILVCVGYPIGVYAIEEWLSIPQDRVNVCVWVFRFACVSCFVGMVTVPYNAMYNAKQYIAELTVYSFFTTTINCLVLYYMVSHPSDWLARYALFTCIIAILPQAIIAVRARFIFPECKIKLKYMWDKRRIREIGQFSGWQFLGVLCAMLRMQGLSIVVNKLFGVRMNAAHNIGYSLQGRCTSLAGSVMGAFVPVISQACGARNFVRMNKFVMRTDKFNILLSAIFMIPLALEIDKVLELWLKTTPSYTSGLCCFAMALYMIDSATIGQMLAVNANGKIALYQVVVNAISILTLPAAVVVGIVWHNIYLVMTAQVGVMAVMSIARLFFAQNLCGTKIRIWAKEVLIPSVLILGVSTLVALIPRFALHESFLRICMTTLCFEVFLVPLAYRFALSMEEREFLSKKIKSRLGCS